MPASTVGLQRSSYDYDSELIIASCLSVSLSISRLEKQPRMKWETPIVLRGYICNYHKIIEKHEIKDQTTRANLKDVDDEREDLDHCDHWESHPQSEMAAKVSDEVHDL